MDTRTIIDILIDYEGVYGEQKQLDDAVGLIEDIPSSTLMNYISGFEINLYLGETSLNQGKTEARLLRSLLSKVEDEHVKRLQVAMTRIAKNKFRPIMFCSQSNLIFYNLIFRNYNEKPMLELTSEEALRVLKALLIVNLHCNNKIQIDNTDIELAIAEDKSEDVTIPNFIYQKDYESVTDHQHQLMKGSMFFEYLENNAKYSLIIKEYYKSLNVSGWKEMFKNLLFIFSQMNISETDDNRKQLVELNKLIVRPNISFIETLCINSHIASYKEDSSFSVIRNKVLYKVGESAYLILNPSFLINHFYKTQFLAFKNFIRDENIQKAFLTTKGKEFTEGIYLPVLIKGAFPTFCVHFGPTALNAKKDELSDVYIRNGNKIILMECKDILLSARAKNSLDKKQLYDEFDIKLYQNQNKRPKGILQLVNAVNDIETNSVAFDSSLPDGRLEIYPIILCTDLSFDIEGMNKIYNEKFKRATADKTFKNIEVHELTFMNINFFEKWEQHLADCTIDIFTLLKEYHNHIKDSKYNLTTFEVFSRFYLSDNNLDQEIEPKKDFEDLFERIRNS